MKKFITVKYRIPGIHYWPDAPSNQEYLRNPHRHEFHFTVFLEVFHEDREVEFIALKEELIDYTRRAIYEFENSFSCEMLASSIIGHLSRMYEGRDIGVWVEEDGENGAFLTATSLSA